MAKNWNVNIHVGPTTIICLTILLVSAMDLAKTAINKLK
jgi:hypothetical protein